MFFEWWTPDWIRSWAFLFTLSMTAMMTSEPMHVISLPKSIFSFLIFSVVAMIPPSCMLVVVKQPCLCWYPRYSLAYKSEIMTKNMNYEAAIKKTEWINELLVCFYSLFLLKKALSKLNEVSKTSLRKNHLHPRKLSSSASEISQVLETWTKKKPTGRPKTARIIRDNNCVSLKHLFQQKGIRYSSTQTRVKKKLKFRPYKVEVCQQLQPGDFARRIKF